MAGNETEGAQVRRGISYLIRIQQEDGTWDEDWFTSPWAIGLRLRCLPDQASALSSREAASDFTAGVSLNLATSLS